MDLTMNLDRSHLPTTRAIQNIALEIDEQNVARLHLRPVRAVAIEQEDVVVAIKRERVMIINTLVVSDISADYAPAGSHLVSTTTDLGITESDVRRHLSIIWGTSTHDWQLVAKYEIPAALPIQSIGRALTQSVKISDDLFAIGDHRAVPSQQGALFSGRLAAELILN